MEQLGGLANVIIGQNDAYLKEQMTDMPLKD